MVSSSGHNLRESWQVSVREHGGCSWRSRQWWVNHWPRFVFFNLNHNSVWRQKRISHWCSVFQATSHNLRVSIYIYIWQNGLNEKLEQDIIKGNLPWSDRWYQPTSDLRIDSLQRCNRTSCFRSIIPVDFRVKFHYKLGLVLPREMTLSNTFSMTILPFVPAFLAISLIG